MKLFTQDQISDTKIIKLFDRKEGTKRNLSPIFVASTKVGIESFIEIQKALNTLNTLSIHTFEDFDSAIHLLSPDNNWFLTVVDNQAGIFRLWQNLYPERTVNLGKIYLLKINEQNILDPLLFDSSNSHGLPLSDQSVNLIDVMRRKSLNGAKFSGFSPNPELSFDDRIKLAKWFEKKFRTADLMIPLNGHEMLKIIPDLLHLLQFESKSIFTVRILEKSNEMLDLEVNIIISKDNMIKSHKIGTWHFDL